MKIDTQMLYSFGCKNCYADASFNYAAVELRRWKSVGERSATGASSSAMIRSPSCNPRFYSMFIVKITMQVLYYCYGGGSFHFISTMAVVTITMAVINFALSLLWR